MKVKIVLVLCVVALASSFAFSQTVGPLGKSSAIFGERCDVQTLFISAPIAGGYEDLTNCSSVNFASMVGWKMAVPLSLGLPLSGGVYGMADSEWDALNGINTGVQFFTMTKLKVSTKKIGYIQLDGIYGSVGLYDYGFMIVDPFAATHKAPTQLKSPQYAPAATKHALQK